MKLFKLPLFNRKKDETSYFQNRKISRLRGDQTLGEHDDHLHKKNLEHQLVQMNIVSEISRKLSIIVRPELLFDQAVHLIQEGLNLYFVGIFMVDGAKTQLLLRAGSGEIGRRLVDKQFSLPITNTSTAGLTIIDRKSHISIDATNNPLNSQCPDLPRCKSEIGIPLLRQDEVIGAINLQSLQTQNFLENETFIYQSLAESLVIALDNANQFRQTQNELKEARSLYRRSLAHSWSEVAANPNELSITFDNLESTDSQISSNSVQLPLTLRDQVIGQITMELGEDSLTSEELSFIDNVSIQTGLALDNARLLDETQKQVSREQLINRLSNQFSRAANIAEILKAALQEIGQMPSVTEVSVFLTQQYESNPSDNGSPKTPLS